MGETLPLLTMVKSKNIDEIPDDLSEESANLLSTLCTLCSFYTVEDFVSFIFSEKFVKLVDYNEPWLVFEIGLYLDHQKNLQLIASKNSYLFVDNTRSNWNGGSLISKTKNEIITELNKWCNSVFEPNARFE